MKAIICLLLCIALARDISGNIFQRHHRRPEISRYYVEPSDYINQYQYSRYQQKQYEPLVNQQKESEEHQIQHRESEERQHWETDQPQQYRYKEYEQPKIQRKESEERQQWETKQPQQYRYREYEQPKNQRKESEQKQYQRKTAEERQYQQNAYEQPQYERKETEKSHYKNNKNIKTNRPYLQQENKLSVISRYADYASESKESQENIVEKQQLPGGDLYAVPMFADMNAPAVYMKKNPEAVYGDVVSWRGIELAADLKNHINQKDIADIYIEAQKSMKHIDPETKTMLHKAVDAATETNVEDASLNATQLLKKYEYPVEEYTIKTEDGYVLTLFRIPPKQMVRDVQKRPVVFLMHGLLGSADDWLLMGPQKSLAYLLSDAGFDVWLGNARSSKYSRHVSKHRAHPDFWQFSNDEIALFDLPAMIDYVLQTSNQEKMYYIGHSLGTTAFFALAATRPVYNEKIMMMYALSPMVYMSHVRSPMVRMIAPTSPLYERLHQQLGHGEFKPNKDLLHTLGSEMCRKEIECKHLCSNVYVVMSGVNVEHLNTTTIPTILSHLPAGGSTEQMNQYGQGVASKDFRRFDYGAEVNEKVYGDMQPPKYDVTTVTAPVTLYFSEHDWLAHPKDVNRLKNELPNVTEAYKVPQDYFTHMDFQFSNQALDVYQRLIDSIQKNYLLA